MTFYADVPLNYYHSFIYLSGIYSQIVTFSIPLKKINLHVYVLGSFLAIFEHVKLIILHNLI